MIFGSTPFSVNAFAAGGDTRIVATGVEATSNTNTVVVVALANLSLTGVAATGSVTAPVVIAEANTSITGFEATSALGSIVVDAQAVAETQGVDSQGYIGTTTVLAEANVLPTSPALSVTVGTNTTVEAKAVVVPLGVIANTNTPSVTPYTVNNIAVTTPGLTIFTKPVSVDENDFDYESIKHLYYKPRVVYTVPQDGSNVVYVQPQNNVVYIDEQQGSNTVYIAA